MSKYRVSINLVWDVEGPDYNSAEQKAQKQLNEITKVAGLNLHKPRISLSKLREVAASSIVLAEYTPDEILKSITEDGSRQQYKIGDKSYWVKLNSQRYFVFAKNPKCVACGIVGTKMFLELPIGCEYPHFNLYAIENGERVLMTKDHKVPVACGGRDAMDNYQTMCSICNNIKGKDILSVENIRALRNFYNLNKSNLELHQLLQEEKARIMTVHDKILNAPRLVSNVKWLVLLSAIVMITLIIACFSFSSAIVGLVLAILGYSAGTMR